MDKDRKYFTDAEEALIEVIANNDELFEAIRNVMWEFELSKAEQHALETHYQANPAMQELVRKLFLPEISKDRELTQCFDLYTTLSIEGKDSRDVLREIKARQVLIDLVESHLAELNGDAPSKSWQSVFTISDDADETYIGLVARNTYLSHIDSTMLRNVKLLAQKTQNKTDEDKGKDSNK